MLTRRATWALAVPILLILTGYVLYPSLRTFVTGLFEADWGVIFGSWRSANVRALWNSVGVSLATVAGAGVVGTGLAWVFYRYTFPMRGLLQSVAIAPLALPPLVGVLAFLFLYGESGMLPRLLQAALGLDNVPFSFDGMAAVWLVHVYVFYVYFYLFAAAALRNLDGHLLEASADLGASGWTTFRRVILPLLAPALVSAALLVFMLSMASFTAPLLFALDEPFLTVQIYNYKLNGDLALSAAVSTILTAICLLFLLLLEKSGFERYNVGAVKGTGAVAREIGQGWARRLLLAGVVVTLVVLLLPIATVVLLSFAENGAWTTQIVPTDFTWANYRDLATDRDFLGPIQNSLVMAGLATAANVVFGVVAALLAVKSRWRGRALIRVLTMLPFAIPGTVIALNLIVTFNQPGALTGGQVLVGSFWILPLAYFIRHIPLVVRATSAALRAYDDRLTEASSDLGASAWTTFRRVTLPIIAPAILAGTLLTFVTALGEFVSSIMLYVPSNVPISVDIYSQLRLYNLGAAAAYSVLLMVLIALATLAVRWVSGKR